MADAALGRMPGPVLIGDIGGTHARFALVVEGHPVKRFPMVRTREHAGIEAAALAAAGPGLSGARSAFLAIAAPIRGDSVHLTNCDWVIEPRRIIGRLGLQEVVLVNDFEAQALALPGLGPDDLKLVNPGPVTEEGTRLVVGPGTGLGAGALINAHGRWLPVPGEGGHIDLSPRDDRDAAIWRAVGGRMSAETILCGPGLVRLYRAIARLDGIVPKLEKPPEVTVAAETGADPVATEAVARFLVHLGAFAGNLALVFMPKGGVYLGGGIVLHLKDRIATSGFLDAFFDKDPFSAIMRSLRISAIIADTPALNGLADVLNAPERYAVATAGRRWARGS